MYLKLSNGVGIKSEGQARRLEIDITSKIDKDLDNSQRYFSFFKERLLLGESLAVHFAGYLIESLYEPQKFDYLLIRDELKSVAISLRAKNIKYNIDFSDGHIAALYGDELNRKIIVEDMNSFKDILNETGRYYLNLWNKELNKMEAEK